MDHLRDQREVGKATAAVALLSRSEADLAAGELVREASRLFPASWVRKAGTLVVGAMPPGASAIGDYDFKRRCARVTTAPDDAIHQYVHHLQATLAGFQRIFREEHIRRTTLPDGTRKPLAEMSDHDGQFRDGGYVDEYFGKHYPVDVVAGAEVELPDAEGLELPTCTFKIVLGTNREEQLSEMAQKDSSMLDLAIGVLFSYVP